MNPGQQLACESIQVQRWLCNHPCMEMPILIALFAKIAGVTMDCPTLESLAAQYNCLPRQNQLPALIYLATQILAAVPPPDYINYAGPPTQNPPAVQNIVVDVNGQQWQYFGNQWN